MHLAAETGTGQSVYSTARYADANVLGTATLSDAFTHCRSTLETGVVASSRAVYGEVGGESPVRFIHEAALRIQNGQSAVAAIVGAEAQYTVAGAMKGNVNLSHWAERDKKAVLLTGREFSAPVAVDHGLCIPTHVYPV